MKYPPHTGTTNVQEKRSGKNVVEVIQHGPKFFHPIQCDGNRIEQEREKKKERRGRGTEKTKNE
jgi:hypothetical protein